jgi:hypothetical protein
VFSWLTAKKEGDPKTAFFGKEGQNQGIVLISKDAGYLSERSPRDSARNRWSLD